MSQPPQAALNAVEQQYAAAARNRSDINEHLPTLRRYATGCSHVTEMGVRWVCSSWGLLAALPARMVCYDVNRHRNVVLLEQIAGRVTDFVFRRQNVLEADIEETDLLFIDTLHTYTQLSAELVRHAGKARRWIILHDTTTFGEKGEDGATPGIWAAIEEFCARGEWSVVERFANNNGLTVLGRTIAGISPSPPTSP